MDQIGLEEMFFYITQTNLVHPQHLELAQGVVLWRTDVDLHMGVVLSLKLLDFKGLLHVLAVAHRKDDGMAILRQGVDHANAEVAQRRVVRRGKPTQQVQDIHLG